MGNYRLPGWDEFVVTNAQVLLLERDKKIVRLRQQVTRLLRSKKDLRLEVRRLQEIIRALGGSF